MPDSTDREPILTANEVLDVAHATSVTTELVQLDDFWTQEARSGAGIEARVGALKPVVERMDGLLEEFQRVARQLSTIAANHAAEFQPRIAEVVEESVPEDAPAGLGGHRLSDDQRTMLGVVVEKLSTDNVAALAAAAERAAAQAEAERERLQQQLSTGSSGGNGGSSVVSPIVDQFVQALGMGSPTGATNGASGGFTGLGCLLGVAIGQPVLGCAVGAAVDLIKMQTSEGDKRRLNR